MGELIRTFLDFVGKDSMIPPEGTGKAFRGFIAIGIG
jgi:hypothetical protein